VDEEWLGDGVLVYIYTIGGGDREEAGPIGRGVAVIGGWMDTHLPMKMEPIVSSETSASNTQTPGIYPKESEIHNCCCFYLLLLIINVDTKLIRALTCNLDGGGESS
jgi:hypothetical protein